MQRWKIAFELALPTIGIKEEAFFGKNAVGSSEDRMPDQIEGLPVADPIPVGTDPGQARPNNLVIPICPFRYGVLHQLLYLICQRLVAFNEDGDVELAILRVVQALQQTEICFIPILSQQRQSELCRPIAKISFSERFVDYNVEGWIEGVFSHGANPPEDIGKALPIAATTERGESIGSKGLVVTPAVLTVFTRAIPALMSEENIPVAPWLLGHFREETIGAEKPQAAPVQPGTRPE